MVVGKLVHIEIYAWFKLYCYVCYCYVLFTEPTGSVNKINTASPYTTQTFRFNFPIILVIWGLKGSQFFYPVHTEKLYLFWSARR